MSKYIRILTTPCADASYTLVDENSNSLGTGTIPSGINDNITAPNASVDVEKTDGTLIENESILSGGSSTITIPDTVVTIAGGTINVMATDPLTIPIKDMDGNVVGSTLVGGEVIISDLPCSPSGDGTIEIYDTDGTLIFTGPVTPETTLTHTIADSTAVLRDTGGNIISTTSIVAEGSEDIIAPDATVTNGATYSDTVASGGTLLLPNENITVNGNLLVNKPSVEDYDVEVVDSDDNPTGVISGGKVVVADTYRWVLKYKDQTEEVIIDVDSTMLHTFASGSGANIGTMEVSTDGITYAPITYPFTPSVGTYYFKRSTALITATYIMIQ